MRIYPASADDVKAARNEALDIVASGKFFVVRTGRVSIIVGSSIDGAEPSEVYDALLQASRYVASLVTERGN